MDLCAYGAPSMKPTQFMVSGVFLSELGLLCPGCSDARKHVQLKGKVMINGKWIYKTKLAQVCPARLCDTYAGLASRALPVKPPAAKAGRFPEQPTRPPLPLAPTQQAPYTGGSYT